MITCTFCGEVYAEGGHVCLSSSNRPTTKLIGIQDVVDVCGASDYHRWRSHKLLNIAAVAMQGRLASGKIMNLYEDCVDDAEALFAEWERRTKEVKA